MPLSRLGWNNSIGNLIYGKYTIHFNRFITQTNDLSSIYKEWNKDNVENKNWFVQSFDELILARTIII